MWPDSLLFLFLLQPLMESKMTFIVIFVKNLTNQTKPDKTKQTRQTRQNQTKPNKPYKPDWTKPYKNRQNLTTDHEFAAPVLVQKKKTLNMSPKSESNNL